MNRCRMPAPAPWAKTYSPLAPAGFVSMADTVPAERVAANVCSETEVTGPDTYLSP